ncbi:NAD(P)/FAD-dependent oxidoreductase [Streptomyces sp. YIM S03343]
MRVSGATHGLVLGGGLAGLLSAHVLARHLDAVTIVERDRLPYEPVPRAGTPQARHSHALMSRGAAALEELVPGTVQALVEAGARCFGMPGDSLVHGSQGWLRRSPGDRYFLACSRDLLEHVIRQRVLRHPRITVMPAVQAVALLGSATAVTGCRVRERDSGTTRELGADFVVDATGRGSDAPRWLVEIGLAQVSETVVDPGLAYATRMFQAPARAKEAFPMVIIQPDSATREPGRSGILLPVEDGRWIVTLAGTRGAEPPVDEEGFERFARDLAHPVLAETLAQAEPVGAVRGFRHLANRRRNFHRMPRWPNGFVVVGDAFATFNPVYGHGMSVAALHARALRDGLSRGGPRRGTARRTQQAVARAGRMAWLIATVQDARRPLTGGRRPVLARPVNRLVDRLHAAATHRIAAAEAVADLFTLSVSARTVLSPAVLLAILRGSRGHTHAAPPPFTPEEFACAGLPARQR